MTPKLAIILSAASGFIAVALGAFGAHGLKHRLDEHMMAVFQTAVQYHFIHTLALLGAGLLLLNGARSGWLMISAWAFVAGILVFSGSLYLLSISGIKWLGAITPLGGLAFLLGWACLLVAAWKM